MATSAPPAMSHKASEKGPQPPQQSTKTTRSEESDASIGKNNGAEIEKIGGPETAATLSPMTLPNQLFNSVSASLQWILDQDQTAIDKAIGREEDTATIPLCGSPPKQNVAVRNFPDEVFAHEFSAVISQAERQAIVKEYNRVMGKILGKRRALDEEVGLAEIEKTIRELKPKEDIICLYVRFARQLPSNFHIDSMATVLCVAKQCNYPPYKFLNEVQTLLICHSTCGYKLSFWFKPGKDEKQIENKFLGLSLTLKLLEATISKSCANLGKVGMRQRGSRAPMEMQVPIGSKEMLQSKLKAPIEFHKQKSLQARLWQGINHRWLAFSLVELLFKHDDLYSWTVKQCFIFSVQIFAPCGPSRYDFLDPIAGFCMRFTNQEEINANRNLLQKIWDAPSTFMQNGNIFLREKSITAKTKLIVACFTDLKALLNRKTKYNRWQPFNTRLQMLRAYTFQFWLEQSANHDIKKAVLRAISPETQFCHSAKVSQTNTNTRPMPVNQPPSKKARTSISVNGMCGCSSITNDMMKTPI